MKLFWELIDRPNTGSLQLKKERNVVYFNLFHAKIMYHKSVAVRLAYGSMSLFIAILHNVFLLYYVDIFVSVYKIDRNSFWLGEVSRFMFFSRATCFIVT